MLPIALLLLSSCGLLADKSSGQTDEAPSAAETGLDTALPDSGGSGEDSASPIGKPVAVCSVAPTVVYPPFESAAWAATGSYDPAGQTISGYDWSLAARPSGSAVTMPSCTGPICSGFAPDLAGTYTGRLVLTTVDGRSSDPVDCDLSAVSLEGLRIEMFWAHEMDDMDLHLIAPGGTLGDGFAGTDCYYATCTASAPVGPLDWGVEGETMDNPSMDLDNISGVGPENININIPARGVYTVAVVDYTGSTPDYEGANRVTVKVYIEGALAWTETRAMSGETTEYFVTVSLPDGTVTPI